MSINTNSTPNDPARQDLPEVSIYCDGSVEPNPGDGGIGVVLLFGKHRREISEPIGHCTNNAAELRAAIAALTALTKTCRVTVYSDSQYLVQTMRGNYTRRSNQELWNDLDFAGLRHEIVWEWIPGHNGNPENERAHQLAYQGMKLNGKHS